MKYRMILLISIVLVVALSPAAAHTRSFPDPDDVDRGPFDQSENSVSHRRINGTRHVVHQLSMYEEWQNSALQDGWISFGFDTRGDFVNERLLHIRITNDGSLYADFFRSNGRLIGYAKVWRPNAVTVKVAFPRRWLGRRITRYSWSVNSDSGADGCYEQQADVVTMHCDDNASGRHRF